MHHPAALLDPEALVPPHPLLWEPLLRAALLEDLGRAGDLTSEAIVPPALQARGRIVARQAGCVAGLLPATRALLLFEPQVVVEAQVGEGAVVAAGETLALVRGPARALLGAERTTLNLLGRLCGIATVTRGVVEALSGTRARVVCTRKTTPGLRVLEKYAVRAGGGANHRFGLDDAVLIKDNHLVLAGSIGEAVARVRRRVGHMIKVEVEVDNLAQLEEALAAGIDAVLLDNMDLATLRRATSIVAGRVLTEASGGIRPDNVAAIASTGVDLLSIGWLTHSAASLDVALDLELA
ncbi:MAG: carboxylating nicotinate-nucleotide diphosphorylase [Proteobacteria bacterium]|nr:carboxylating nicotinate-nucleotide diphosphorylase [Pseudomonadota bacterium]